LLTEPPLFGSDPLKRRLKPAAIPLWIWTLSRVTRLSRPGLGLFTQTHGNKMQDSYLSQWIRSMKSDGLATMCVLHKCLCSAQDLHSSPVSRSKDPPAKPNARNSAASQRDYYKATE
ncbi:hypothetical protein KUCAC02_019128, partial [Chaenocephalus aceratus]